MRHASAICTPGLKNCSFYLTRDRNAWYPQTDKRETSDGIDWPVKNGSQDLVTAMSVFTHIQERDSKGYLNKIHEVLADDGLAILSFLVIRDFVNSNSTFHFKHPLTPGWFTSNPACPEMAIGVTQEALEKSSRANSRCCATSKVVLPAESILPTRI